jgi:ADP-ribose pyrophosphatase YjhB (NUDIX family)
VRLHHRGDAARDGLEQLVEAAARRDRGVRRRYVRQRHLDGKYVAAGRGVWLGTEIGHECARGRVRCERRRAEPIYATLACRGDEPREEELTEAPPLEVVDDGDGRLRRFRVVRDSHESCDAEPFLAAVAPFTGGAEREVMEAVELREVPQLRFRELPLRREEAPIPRLGRHPRESFTDERLVFGADDPQNDARPVDETGVLAVSRVEVVLGHVPDGYASGMDWLDVVRTLQRIGQAGLAYTEGVYDRERYTQLLDLAAKIGAAALGGPITRMEEALSAEKGYPTPKVDVRAVVPKNGELLFVRETADGLWSLPGGWADIGSSPAEMVAREVLEESGYIVVPTKLLALLDKSKHAHPRELHWVYKVFCLCELRGGEARASHETHEAAFFGRDALPPLSLPRVTPSQVALMFEHLDHPDRPTDFD